MKKWITMLLVLTLLASLLTGFAVTADAADAPEEETAAEADETAAEAEEEDLSELIRIGQEPEEEDSGYRIKLVNATGSSIKGINIQTTEDDTWVWSDEMMPEGYVFEDGETALFCYTPGEEEDEQTLYNLQIVFTDWTVGFLHYVPLSDMDAAEMHRAANSLPYLVYTSLTDETEIDTSAAEQQVFEGELAAGFWTFPSNDTSSSGGSSSGGSSGGGSTGGNSEGCIDDALFY